MSDRSTVSREHVIAALTADPRLAHLSFEPVEVAGIEAVVTRLVPPEASTALWRAASERCPEGFGAILTDDRQVHPDIMPVGAVSPMSLDFVRAARMRVVRRSPAAAAALDAITRTSPQPEPYDERDSFLQVPEYAQLSLVLVRGSRFEAVRPFTPDGDGRAPRSAELMAMLASFGERYGAVPLHAEGGALELEVDRPPRDLDELRAAARDVFLLSQGTPEGYGVEEPVRILRRLMSDRWVLWWYGTT